MIDPTYLPELDDGVEAAGWNVVSADLWIAKEEIGNVDAFIRAHQLETVNSRTMDIKRIPLAKEMPYHVVVPRHLSGIRAKLKGPIHFVELDLEHVDFPDRINLREAQEPAWDELVERKHGILQLGCGKGKTVLGLKKIASRQVPAVVVVNNTGLVTQWVDRIQEHLGLSSDDIGLVRGKKAQWDRKIVICMIQTLAKRYDQIPLEIRLRFGTALFDEVHHLSAASFLKTANIFFGSRYGLTATLEREDGLEGAYIAHLGEPFYKDLEGDLNADIYFHRLKTEFARNADIKDVSGEISLGKVHIELGRMRSRNKKILDMVFNALKSGRRILALTHAAEHPEILKEMFDADARGKGYKSGAISGQTSGEDRLRVLEQCNVTFATFGVAREGLDAKELDTVFFLTPFKAWGGFQQGKGRIERLSPGKKKPIVVVLEDHRIGVAYGLCRSLKRKIRANGINFRELG